jgi:hypothetical protein
MSLILDGTNGLSDVDGSAATPAIRGSDANTGVFFGTDIVGVSTGGTERVRVDASGNVGIGTSSPAVRLQVASATTTSTLKISNSTTGSAIGDGLDIIADGTDGYFWNRENGPLLFGTNNTERARIDSSGTLLVGKTSADDAATGVSLEPSATESYNFTQGDGTGTGWVILCNRQGSDGPLIQFRQANTTEGNITVSGTTVSYNGGHLSRWAQTTTAKDESLVKGTVLSNLDEMNVYTDADGNPVDNEQLNKVKVSDVEGDANVAGVFVNWTHDEQHNLDEINMAMTGDMIIRIAQGVTVQRGDLLMSAGDGTAKPQGDDIVRSKTVAKVTSTHVTCTYADGSFCVPCVLMAC